MKALDSGELVLELNGIAGECLLLAMQCVRDSKAGATGRNTEAFERRSKKWVSIRKRVERLNDIFLSSTGTATPGASC